MKKRVTDKIIDFLHNNIEFDQYQEDLIRYGIGNIYLFIGKLIVLTAIAISLNIFYEYLMFLIPFALLRNISFGVHAKKSWQCWFFSILIFIGIPLISQIIIFDYKIKICISYICVLLIYYFSPADTEKRPIVSLTRRQIFKYLSTLLSVLYSFLLIYSNNNILVNSLLFSLLIQVIIISPYMYRVLGVNYNNYKKYRKEDLYG